MPAQGGPRPARHRVLGWAACAVVALVFGLVSGPAPHRVWGGIAAAGYAAAALVAGRPGGGVRRSAVVAVTGAVALPLLLLVATGRGQLEVDVVERSGELLLRTGSPYLPEPAGLADYNPYLPGMAVFGALPGDARWWLAACFLGALTLAVRRSAPVLLIAACPPVALPLAVGGVDLPVAGLMCLGLTLAGQGRAGRAGLVLGAAAALKWTAWPALPVAVALLAARSGRRPALRCGAVALTAGAAAVVPVALADPTGFHRNVIAFPLGLTTTPSPAATPFPGRLLADHVPGGALVASVLLAVAAVLLAGSLLVRPPRTVAAAARRLALGLTVAIALMPASRFGYLVHPLVLLACSVRFVPRGPLPLPQGGTPCPELSPGRSSSPMTSRPGKEVSKPSSGP
ncbi:glycosyltransferase 87 family protein [Streptomyces sp. NPDC092295]|uniref:glycosyltransferase 87 family protein n=1 Tax=Streptomyces sp. NPDC092295 TaxID=3366011 RepID=UPI0038179548